MRDGLQWQVGDDAAQLPRVDAILALWGVTRGDAEQLDANAELACAAMELGRVLGAGRVLHASTQAVYQPSNVPIPETGATEPAGAYGQSKLAAERAVERWCAEHPDGPRAVQMRIGNVAGAESLFANLKPEGTVTLDQFGDGTGPQRSYIAPQDLAQVIAALLRADIAGAVNVAAPQTTAMAAIARAAGAGVIWKPAPQGAMQSMSLDTRLLQGLCALPDTAADPARLVDGARASGVWP
ncbi:NAD-dependent epimerase/dehydratase family protein [Primorskyibacter sp. 2E107]|uniref:NAD-dependent epimerase/dehydratase family protein n=1 Tax=Primorskyibacter sp. 2E107 TaxID=3403458 RepID=UPI003AF4A088